MDLLSEDAYISSQTQFTPKNEIMSRYEAYLATNAKPIIHGHNPLNLFDDMDCYDIERFMAVRKFIEMKGLSCQTY